MGPLGVLEGEDAGVFTWEALLGVPCTAPPALQSPVLGEAHTRGHILGCVNLQASASTLTTRLTLTLTGGNQTAAFLQKMRVSFLKHVNSFLQRMHVSFLTM